MSSRKKPTAYALVDCNNFFASCERVFRPELTDRPIAVLSNNDGCVIARSYEVKALDIPMAAPYFKVKDKLDSINTAIFSANFQLYGDMSWRIVEGLKQFSPHIEVYSIDECFLDISDVPVKEHVVWLNELHKSIQKWTGIPVSVGVAPTKTLAKLATARAKKEPEWRANGGLSLMDDSTRGTTSRANRLTEEILKTSSVGEAWGVGRRLGPKLNSYGITNLWDLIQLDDDWIQREMTIKGLRMVEELRGNSCISIDENDHDDEQKSISTTRTFGHNVMAYHRLESAIASFSARVAAKLRKKQQLASEVTVFLRTNKHGGGQYHRPMVTRKLPYPTADTGEIIKLALEILKTLPVPNYAYKQAGVIATELTSDKAQQVPLFGDITDEYLDGRNRLNQAVDDINNRYGRGTMTRAVVGLKKQQWHASRKLVSPAYTSRWEQIPSVH